jgi:hypothetical protein
MLRGMRAFRFALFLALLAGLLSAAGYLWAPLVAPEVPRLHLASPSIRSRVIEPLRIAPLEAPLARAGHLVPSHVAGAFLVHRPAVLTPHLPAPIAVTPHTIAPTLSPVVHRAPTPAAVKHQVAAPVVSLPVPVAPHVAHVPAPPPVTPHPAPAPPVVVVPATPSTPLVPVPATPAVAIAVPEVQAQPVAPQVQVVTNAPAAPAAPAPITPSPTPAPPAPPSTIPPPSTPVPTPIPTPIPTPTDDSGRPGWGCGDKNHVHGGPANATQPSPCK